jgi:hypothetical protein
MLPDDNVSRLGDGWKRCHKCGRNWGAHVAECLMCRTALPQPAAVEELGPVGACPTCGTKMVPDPAGQWCPRAHCDAA